MNKTNARIGLGALSPCVRVLFRAAPLALLTATALAALDTNSPDLAWWRDSMRTHDQRMAWWREARFGMFVHWGVYSHLGGTWQGQPVTGYAEHIQRKLKIPIPVYREQVAGRFNPAAFNAEEWIRTAKEAGMGYFIITAKHHDGFAIWPSRVSDYNLTNCTPFKRDPMRELKTACQKYGLKFGFYYSHAFDWGDANGPGNDWDYDNPGGDRNLHGGRNWWAASPQLLPKVRQYVDGKSIPQLLELIRNYDPDILWFDTPHKLPDAENLRIMKAVRAASPRVVINGRLARGLGDYASTADRPAEFAPHEDDWEGIPTTNESYGWNQNDLSHKPPGHFIQVLAKAAARGGNILMNVGPMGTGKLDPNDTAILQGIGAWWKVNGSSIRGTTRTPLAAQAWGESTRQGHRLYLHVFDWPRQGQLVVGGLKSNVKQAWLLADQKRAPLRFSRSNPLDLQVEVPLAAPDKVDSVVVLECDGGIAADTTRLLSATIATNALRVFDGQLQGRLRFGAGKKTDAYVQDWSRRGDFIAWPARVTEAASFDVAVVFDAEAASVGGTFVVKVGEREFPGTVKQGVEQTVALGQVTLSPGAFEIRVEPKEIKGNELMRLRSLTLQSAPNRH
ncbi:MAG: alpha-L-fucosidase [Verrucomicrobia bacterium]|nr:alpha-L-fucosidase [Verrucomicrobiota bacterium]